MKHKDGQIGNAPRNCTEWWGLLCKPSHFPHITGYHSPSIALGKTPASWGSLVPGVSSVGANGSWRVTDADHTSYDTDVGQGNGFVLVLAVSLGSGRS